MEFDVFVGQKKVTPQIEAALRGQVTEQLKPFDMSTASPSAKLVGGWLEDLIRITKERLERSGINASNQLSQSISVVPIDLNETTLTLGIQMNGYWKFVDLGVKGAKSSAKAPSSPFQYREKMPPPRAIQEWIAFKSIPLQGRDKQAAARGLSFAIGRRIRDYGTKPTYFFSEALTPDKINVLVEDIAAAIGKDIGVALNV